MATYTYHCAAHGTLHVVVDTDKRHVGVFARGTPNPGDCVLPRIAYLACSDRPGGQDRPDAPLEAAIAERVRPGTSFPGCEVTRT